MNISYNKLWKLLIDRKMSNTDLRRVSGICPNTLTKLRRDQMVSMPVLDRICAALGVDIEHIAEFSTKEKLTRLILGELYKGSITVKGEVDD